MIRSFVSGRGIQRRSLVARSFYAISPVWFSPNLGEITKNRKRMILLIVEAILGCLHTMTDHHLPPVAR